MNSTFWKFALYIWTNWVLFYVYIFFSNFYTIRYSSKINANGIFLAIIMLALIPAIELILFIPFNYIIRQVGVKLVLGILTLLALEFALNVLLANGQPEQWMYVKGIISFLVGLAFYYRATSARTPE